MTEPKLPDEPTPDLMLHGVLRMPYEMAMGDELTRYQYWHRAQQALDELTSALALAAEREGEIAELKHTLATTRSNHALTVETANRQRDLANARAEAAEANDRRYRVLRIGQLGNRIKVENFTFPRATWELIDGADLDAAIDAMVKP